MKYLIKILAQFKQWILSIVRQRFCLPLINLNAKYKILLIWWRYDNKGEPHKIGLVLFNHRLHIRYRNVA